MRLILENRYVFDGSIARTAKHDAHHGADDPSHHAAPHHDQASAPDAAAAHAPAQPANVVAGPKQPADVQSVVFIDPRVANWQTLAAGAAPGVAVLLVDPAQDGLAQVAHDLAPYHNLQSIQFVTYGQPGAAYLGATAITSTSMVAEARLVASWRDHVADGGTIDFWGCDVGAGQAGQAFVDTLHALTGVAVGASTDATGAGAAGGNWLLERTEGAGSFRTPFSADAIAAYGNVLDRPDPVVAFVASTVPTGILLGSTFTESVTFTNAATTAAGYAPFIDVFLPSNAAEHTTLNSASYLGSTLTVTSVTLSTTVAGHAGVLGALHPYATDAAGAPLFVAAPAGYVAGDTLYAVKLPFGSFTPGQPSAQIDLSLTVAATSELTAIHPSAAVNVTAIGGFALGADPLNDPATDPSIRGTSATEAATTSDAGNGLVAVTSAVTLLNFDSTIVTAPGEDETATGPDFIEHYQVTLNPADATANNPITNLVTSLVLPNDVTYTGGTITVTGASGTASFAAASSPQGGTVTTSFASLAAGGTRTVIDIPIYVPRTDAAGAAILDPVSGAPVNSLAPAATYFNGTWSPVYGSLDFSTPEAVSGAGDAGEAVFVDKSLAVQEAVSDTTNAFLTPGDGLTYTIKFEVSDYFSVSNLLLQASLSDGQTVDPTQAVSLTVTTAGATHTVSLGIPAAVSAIVNGQTVSESGTAPYWTYTRDDTGSGQTTLNFAAGDALATALGTSLISGGGTGTLTFHARALDKYTNTYGGQTLTEADPISSTASGTAKLLTMAGVPTASPAASVSDSSGTGLTVPHGASALAIVAVNGVAVTGTPSVTAGDIVTYKTSYALNPTNDFDNLTLAAYLPLPVFSTADPAANGTATAFTAAVSGSTMPGVGVQSRGVV